MEKLVVGLSFQTFLSWYRNLMAIIINLLNLQRSIRRINQTDWYLPDLFCKGASAQEPDVHFNLPGLCAGEFTTNARISVGDAR